MNKRFYDNAITIDNLLSSSSNLNEIESLFNIKGVRRYFFNKILSIDNMNTWFAPLYEKGFFDVKNHPQNEDFKPYIPYWDVLEYLKKVSEENEENENSNITTTLIEIINPIIIKSNVLDNFRTDYYIGQIISTLPIDKFSNEYFKFIQDSLNKDQDLITDVIQNKIIPKLLKNNSKDLLLNLLKIILNFKITKRTMIENETIESFSVLSDYWLMEIINKYKDEIIKTCGIEIVNLIIEIMEKLITINSSAFNHIWIPTIENHPQTSFKDRYECQIVYLLRDVLESIKSDRLLNILDDLLTEQHYIFRRIAIHIINYKYKDLSIVFWTRNWNPINEIVLKHEVYELLKSHSGKFSDEQIDKIITWIETAEYFENQNDIIEEHKIKITAYVKKEWYSTLLSSKYINITDKYKQYDEINPTELDHPGFNSWTEGSFGGADSPITSDQIIQMSIEELVNYLNSYQGETGWPKSYMSYHGLGNELKQAVFNEPTRYVEHINDIISVPYIFHYSIISGFKEVIEKDKKTIIKIDSLVEYISKITHQEEFINYSENQLGYSIEGDILRMSGWLIEDILRSDEVFLSNEDYILVENILFHFESITKTRTIEPYFNNSSDVISLVLNSPKGIVYNNFILYSLKYNKFNQIENNKKWKESIKTLFNDILHDKSNKTLEFYIILGEYIRQIYYLDSEWLINNINYIFPNDGEELWRASFTGYLSRSNTVDKVIFDLLKSSGDYSKAIRSNLKGGFADEQLIRHILVSYIQGWEDILDENSLIYQLLEFTDIKDFRIIVNFIWSSREFIKDQDKQRRVKELWGKLILKTNQFNIKQNDKENDIQYHESISEILDWLSIFDNIDDDILRYVIVSIKNAKQNFRIRFLLQNLNKFIEKQPAEVGKIFITLLETGNYPSYPDKEIKELVGRLYRSKQNEYADLICNKYGEEGFYFLREIYYENNFISNKIIEHRIDSTVSETNTDRFEIIINSKYDDIIRNIIEIPTGKPGIRIYLKYKNKPLLECVLHRDSNDRVWISTNMRKPHNNPVRLTKFLKNIGMRKGDHVELRYINNETLEILT